MFKSSHFNMRNIIMSLALILFLIFIIQLPFLNNNSYLITVYNNEAQANFPKHIY